MKKIYFPSYGEISVNIMTHFFKSSFIINCLKFYLHLQSNMDGHLDNLQRLKYLFINPLPHRDAFVMLANRADPDQAALVRAA